MKFNGNFQVLEVSMSQSRSGFKVLLSNSGSYFVEAEMDPTRHQCYPGNIVQAQGTINGVRGGRILAVLEELLVIQ